MKWTGIVLLVLAIFHRPLFFGVVRLALIKIAAKHNVKLDVSEKPVIRADNTAELLVR